MSKESFIDWLNRLDVPVEHTGTVDAYLDYLETQLGIHGGSLTVAKDVYAEKYNYLAELDIFSFPRHYIVAGEKRTETRYAISGYPGSWGRERAIEIAIEKAIERDWREAVEWLEARREE